jgi:E3 ubiquitin-protein ligase UBR4
MVDGVGVCTICARVCHAGHDVTYSKHGSFFCDCGAKEDGSCIALVKRTSSAMVKYTRKSIFKWHTVLSQT